MKKTILAAIAALALAAGVSAQTAVGTWNCGSPNAADVIATLTDDGTMTIRGTGRMGDYDYNSTPWYSTRVSIKAVIIENGVTSIGNYAFRDCGRLTSVTIGDGVTSIGREAFSGCSGLTSVTIGDGVMSIRDDAFRNCSGLTSVTIPNSVTSIGKEAFRNCSGLTSITIPNGVRSIEQGTFYGCSGLTSVTIGDGVMSIRDDAFRNCSGLTSLTIPVSVTSIGSGAFTGVSNITSLTITGTGDMKDYISGGPPWNNSSGKITNVVIGAGVTSIGSNAFYDCSGLTSVTIPDGVTSIGDYAFRNCSGLTSLTIPDGVTSIGSQAFAGCSGLTSITIPDGVTGIGKNAFAGCSGLTEINVAADNPVLSSENGVLFSKNKTTLIICPKGKRGAYVIPDGVTSIGDYAFYDCSGLTSVIIPDGVTSIGREAFAFCGTTSITIGDGVTSIGYRAFYAVSFCIYVPEERFYDYKRMIGSDNCIRATAYTVKFDAQNGSAVTRQTVQHGAKLTEPTAPERTGYTFGGWYKEENCINKWDFAVGEVTETGITLYAKWSGASPISKPVKSDGGLGIIFESNMVGGEKYKRLEIREVVISRSGGKTVTGKIANVKIYDNVGNVVFSGGAGANTWDLRNKSGRLVANGGYLVVVEAEKNNKKYWYSAKIGVKIE